MGAIAFDLATIPAGQIFTVERAARRPAQRICAWRTIRAPSMIAGHPGVYIEPGGHGVHFVRPQRRRLQGLRRWQGGDAERSARGTGRINQFI